MIDLTAACSNPNENGATNMGALGENTPTLVSAYTSAATRATTRTGRALAELQHAHAAISNQHHGLIDGEYRAFEMLQHIGESKTA